MSTQQRREGLGAIDSDHFDLSAAVGGWRGVVEATAPTLVFITVLVLRPDGLLTAITASLVVSAVALLARLLARQPLTQVLSGAVLALISAAWAWRSGQAANFYASGLIINAAWLAVTAGSLLVRRPLVGALISLWHTARGEGALEGWTGQGQDLPAPASAPRRTTPAQQRRYAQATAVLAGMFALRLVVEVPLYLAGESALSALGVARLVLGVPLYAVCLWFAWLIARPRPEEVA